MSAPKYVCVPVEPTEEMLECGAVAVEEWKDDTDPSLHIQVNLLAAAWPDLLAARPEPDADTREAIELAKKVTKDGEPSYGYTMEEYLLARALLAAWGVEK